MSGSPYIKFIDFRGKSILRIEYPPVDNEDLILSIIAAAEAIITSSPDNSLLTLTIIGDFNVTPLIILRFKEYNLRNKRHVRHGAIVGLEGMKLTIYNALESAAKRHLCLFDDEGSALDYLAGSV